MHTKALRNQTTIMSYLQLVWARITFSRITIIYFAFSLAHCAIQVGFQSRAFSINERAASFLQSILDQAGGAAPGFAVVSDGLRICQSIPDVNKGDDCDIVWAKEALAPPTATNSIDADPSAQTPAVSVSIATTPVPAVAVIASPAVNPVPAPRISPSLVPLLPLTTTTFVTVTAAIPATPSLPPNQNFRQPADVGDESELEFGDSGNADGATSGVVPARVSVFPVQKRKLPFGRIAATTKEDGSVVVNLGTDVTLDQSCVLSLTWPTQKLENTKREDITFISFQLWVLGMSVVALLNESMPHIIASLLTHVLATAWGGFQLAHTADFRRMFTGWITNGACKGTNLLPNYWNQRRDAEIPSEVLNVVALLISMFLSFKLIKLFGWQTFKRVGASRSINRIYKIVLTLSIAIQLSLFFMVVSLALWIDQLYNGAVGKVATETKLYKAIYIVIFLLLTPWLTLGWFSARREWKKRMLAFLVLSVGYVIGFAAMFFSKTFRWTFLGWTFFSIITTAGAALACLTFLLGLTCRLNFGKGLPRHLMSQESLHDPEFVNPYPEGDQKEYDPEKVEFPSNQVVPAYAASFEYAAPELPRQVARPISPPTEARSADEHHRAPSNGSAVSRSTRDPFDEVPRSPIQGSPRSSSLGRQNSVFSNISSSSRGSELGYQSSSTNGSLSRGPPTTNHTIPNWVVSGTSPPRSGQHARQFSGSSTSSSSRYGEGRSRRWVIE